MHSNAAIRNWLLGFLATVTSVVVCVAYIDRPLAEFFDRFMRRTAAWDWVDRALAPFALVVVMAMLFLFGCGAWLGLGRRLPSWTTTPLLCSRTAMWGTAVEVILKRIFGRSPAAPLYIRDHVYEFRFLRGGFQHWGSFPSGTALVSTAILAALWAVLPRWRVPGSLIVTLLCAAVVVTNYHWLADVIAGVFVGAAIGRIAVVLERPTFTAEELEPRALNAAK